AAELAQRLRTLPQVEKVDIVSPQAGIEEMRKDFPELVEGLATNPLPWSLRITPREGEEAAAIANRLDPPPPKVDKVDYGKETTDRILSTARIIEIAFLVAAVILLAASTILIANTIRLSIFSRRREIEVMKLVGATN